MKTKQALWTGIASAVAMLLIILDARTALTGASSGIDLCIKTVIPSLYPFFILSNLISTSLVGRNIAALRPLGRLCGIPEGAESLMVLGFIGGYPVGARSIYQSYKSGVLRKEDAERMLGFCNNAGPAFIFGMVASLFSSPLIPWVLLASQIVSAICVAAILPNKSCSSCRVRLSKQINVTALIEQSTKTMAVVCSWVVLFRIVIAFAQRWVFWLFAPALQTIIVGLLELSNGCFVLHSIPCEGTRFILSACFLSLGGLCVALQTMSVIGDMNTRFLIAGKMLQCLFNLITSIALRPVLFAEDMKLQHSIFLIIGAVIAVLIISFCLHSRKKVVAFIG